MQSSYSDKLHKLKTMTIRCKKILGDDYYTMLEILNKHIKENKVPSKKQMRLKKRLEELRYK